MRSVEKVSITILFADGTISPCDVATADRAAGWAIEPADLVNRIQTIVDQQAAAHPGKSPATWRFQTQDDRKMYAARDGDVFRDAWTDNGGTIKVDMGKARELHREHLRRKRTPLLVDLDQQYLRALESNDKPEQKRIADRKKVLRDITAHPAIDAAQTPEQLKVAALDALE